MKQFADRRLRAWTDHHEMFTCECEFKELRTRVIKGGAVQYVYQCQKCGEVSLQALARAKALALFGGAEPPPLDVQLREAWREAKSTAGKQVNASVSSEFWSEYDSYLASPEWAKRRRLVLQRAGTMCEGCGACPPTEVHHLTYEHVGNEFLFELVAVCHSCHARLHPDDEA